MPLSTRGSAVAVVDVDVTQSDEGAGAGPPTGRRRAALGPVLLLLGIAVTWFALEVLEDMTALPRVAIVLAGLAVAYVGLDRVLRSVFGRRVETDLWLAVIWVVAVVVAAVLADVLPLKEAQDASQTFGEPVRARPDLFSAHPLGTDSFGLDLLGGVIYGARLSLQISFGAVAIGLVIGGLIGVCAGYFRGWFDSVAGILTDSMLAFPPLILLIALMVAVQPTVPNLVAALALLGIPTYIRLARANTLTLAQREFVTAARAMGARSGRIILRELVPNVALPLLSYAFIIVAVLIVAEGSLSFLGLSIPRPRPTWGNMINAGAKDLDKHPHLVFVPATVMFLTVFALNRIGDKARKLWDPREAKV
jgi:peptide/nickel transport system permease protein